MSSKDEKIETLEKHFGAANKYISVLQKREAQLRHNEEALEKIKAEARDNPKQTIELSRIHTLSENGPSVRAQCEQLKSQHDENVRRTAYGQPWATGGLVEPEEADAGDE